MFIGIKKKKNKRSVACKSAVLLCVVSAEPKQKAQNVFTFAPGKPRPAGPGRPLIPVLPGSPCHTQNEEHVCVNTSCNTCMIDEEQKTHTFSHNDDVFV